MLNFDQDVVTLARDLIGAQLLVRGVGGTVLETEAYGRDDPASHSFSGPSMRNAAMFGPAGTVYVYLSYGCHLCLNVVGRPGEAVLIRAIRPEVGLAVMRERRGYMAAVASGPGRVGQALGIGLHDCGKRFGGGEFLLDPASHQATILTGLRIGISRAADLPWRFGLAGATGLSRPFTPTGSQEQISLHGVSPPVDRRGGKPMPNAPEPAARKRTPPTDRRNAQDDHEGSPHRPEEFDEANPAKRVPSAQAPKATPRIRK